MILDVSQKSKLFLQFFEVKNKKFSQSYVNAQPFARGFSRILFLPNAEHEHSHIIFGAVSAL